MIKKGVFGLLIGFIFLISLFGIVSSVDSCSLVPADTCSDSNTVLNMYKTSNSHGEVASYSSTFELTGEAILSKGTPSTLDMYALCCNFVGSRTCTSSGSNEVLSLSSLTNAHAEIPSLNTYSTKVCFDGLSCIGKTNPTDNDEKNYPIKMVSLSSNTNAHLAYYNSPDYTYKILCKKTGSTPPPAPTNLGNSNFNLQGTANPLKLDSNQIGTSASKVNVKITNLNANSNSNVYMEVYEKNSIPLPKGNQEYTPSIKPETVAKTSSNFVFKITQGILRLTAKITGKVILKSPSQREIYTPIRTGNQKIVGKVVNGDAIFEWTITNSDLKKAAESDGTYEFYFNISVGDESRMFGEGLNVQIQGKNNSNQNKNKFWLDSDRKTKINQKTMNWENLTKSNTNVNLENLGTGNVIKGLGTGTITLKNSNLVYMAASGLPISANTIVYFEVYEKDSSEGGLDDLIRTGSSITASMGADGNVSASWFVSQEDIKLAKSDDNLNADGSITYEFYFKIIDSSTESVYDPLGDELLNLKIIYLETADHCGNGLCEPEFGETIITCPADCKKITGETYLSKAEGAWADEALEYEITDYIFIEGQDNVVGLFVGYINLMNEPPEDMYFEVWEKDFAVPEANSDGLNNNSPTIDYDDAIITDGSLSGLVAEEGIAAVLWFIKPEQLALAGQEDSYEFYFNIRYKNENKSFRDALLNLSIENDFNNGGDDDCENVYYCSDHLTKSMCNNPCNGVLENEITLNSEAECSNSNVDCYCAWDDESDECFFAYSNSMNEIGLCEYTQAGVEEDCDVSGYIKTNYNAIWSWQPDNCYSSLEGCLETIENGIDESCIEKDSCWRKVDSTYLTCENYEEVTLCSYGGDPGTNIGGYIQGDKNDWWWIILLIFGILVIGAFIWFFIIRRKREAEKEIRLFKTKQNFLNLSNYIAKEKKAGKLNYEIKDRLLKVGWTAAQVDYAMKKISKDINMKKKSVTNSR